jgi:NADPH-dependent curcumin reductase CurA
MTERINREIRLKSRPIGMPTLENFELVETPAPEPKQGELLVRNIWMSVDPYMRGRMADRESYVPPFQIGHPLDGGCVGQVIESTHHKYKEGDYVSSMLGWREYWVSDGSNVHRARPEVAPIQTFLGALGMTGLTAYVGLTRVGKLREGENVFVSAAAGAVGSIACQIAKAAGCRVAGSAGSDEKVRWLMEEGGVDYAFNYKKQDNLRAEMARAMPEGIDVYFDNVGGEHLEAALALMRRYGRVAACGMISQYNDTDLPPGPRTIVNIIPKRIRIQGFIVSDFRDATIEFQEAMSRWIAEGKVKWRETVAEGLENAPKALLGLFRGDNLGKMLVKISPDPVPEMRQAVAGTDTLEDQDALRLADLQGQGAIEGVSASRDDDDDEG